MERRQNGLVFQGSKEEVTEVIYPCNNVEKNIDALFHLPEASILAV